MTTRIPHPSNRYWWQVATTAVPSSNRRPSEPVEPDPHRWKPVATPDGAWKLVQVIDGVDGLAIWTRCLEPLEGSCP